MSETEFIERLCRINAEQSEVIREQALLLGQLGCDEFSERRNAVEKSIKDIKRESRCEF